MVEILWKRLAGETDWTSVQEVEKISIEIFELAGGRIRGLLCMSGTDGVVRRIDDLDVRCTGQGSHPPATIV